MKTDGSGRCGRYAIKGGTVCRVHGGAAPQVQAKALRTLAEQRKHIQQEVVPKAIRLLEAVLDNTDAEQRDQIRAAIAILDRGGHGPTADLRITVDAATPEEIAAAEAELSRLFEQAEQNRLDWLRRDGGWRCPKCEEFCCEPPDPELLEAPPAPPAEPDEDGIVDAEIIEFTPHEEVKSSGPDSEKA